MKEEADWRTKKNSEKDSTLLSLYTRDDVDDANQDALSRSYDDKIPLRNIGEIQRCRTYPGSAFSKSGWRKGETGQGCLQRRSWFSNCHGKKPAITSADYVIMESRTEIACTRPTPSRDEFRDVLIQLSKTTQGFYPELRCGRARESLRTGSVKGRRNSGRHVPFSLTLRWASSTEIYKNT